jgi:hypothetical protein
MQFLKHVSCNTLCCRPISLACYSDFVSGNLIFQSYEYWHSCVSWAEFKDIHLTNQLHGAKFPEKLTVAQPVKKSSLFVFCNPKVHYRVHKSRPADRVLSQMNLVHIFTSCLKSSVFMLSSHLSLDRPTGLFPSSSTTAFISPCMLYISPISSFLIWSS